MTPNQELARQQMIEQQVRAWNVLDPGVLTAMATVRREDFVPPAFRGVAFADDIVPLGHGQCMLAPKVDGRILKALAVTPDDDVLDVGTGSGYLAACLARLAARVHSIEIFPDLAERALANLHTAAINNCTVAGGDATKLADEDRYNAIAVSASLPLLGVLSDNCFARALKVGGRLLLIVGQPPVMEALKITRIGKNEWRQEPLFETSVPALQNAARPSRFVF